MVLVIINSFFSMFELSSLAMSKFVGEAGRRCNKIAEIGVERVICEGN